MSLSDMKKVFILTFSAIMLMLIGALILFDFRACNQKNIFIECMEMVISPDMNTINHCRAIAEVRAKELECG